MKCFMQLVIEVFLCIPQVFYYTFKFICLFEEVERDHYNAKSQFKFFRAPFWPNMMCHFQFEQKFSFARMTARESVS